MTLKGSDNQFPLVRIMEDANDATPAPTGQLHLKADSATKLPYVVDDVGTMTPLGGSGYAPGGTDVAVADGGTGASSAGAARTNLGLVIGTDVQAFDADIPTVAASQAEAEAGTETALRSFSPLRIAQAIAALESGGGGSGQESYRQQIDPFMYSSHTNWSTVVGLGIVAANKFPYLESTGAQNAEVTYEGVALSAGTYTVMVKVVRHAAGGIIDVQLNTVSFTTFDTYVAGTNADVILTNTGISLASSGIYQVKMKMGTKNASSSSYYGDIHTLLFIRTA